MLLARISWLAVGPRAGYRWIRVLDIVLGALLVLSSIKPTHAQTELDSWPEEVIRQVAQAVAPSVVQIQTIGGVDLVEGTQVAAGPTTGLIVDASGYILTSSFNLIQEPSAILVKLHSGTRLSAEVVGRDESRHLVLLKVETREPLRVPKTKTRDQLQVGQSVIALGKSFDATAPNLSTGILSATNRIWGKAIQCDAKVSPTNFGGPLVDLSGNVLGILVPMSPNSSSALAGIEWYDSGIGFAVPLTEIYDRLGDLKEGKILQPGLLGLSFRNAESYGAEVIVAACPGSSPAARAGIKPGDKILKINEHGIERPQQLKHALGPLYAGDVIDVTFQREQEVHSVRVELVGEIQPFRHVMLGVLPEHDSGNSGVAVKHVISGTAAEQSGIVGGDVIVVLGDQKITDIPSLRSALLTYEPEDQVELRLLRADKVTTVEVLLTDLDARVLPVSEKALDDSLKQVDDEIQVEEVSVPEFPNRGYVYVPATLQPNPGLLVWITEAGEINTQQEIAPWRQWCDTYNVVLLIPQSHDKKAWQPGETEFVGKLADQAIIEYSANKTRVVVAGQTSGAKMASLVAFENRSLFGGLATVNSGLSQRIGQPQSGALHRMLILMLDDQSDKEVSGQQDQQLESLKQNGLPVSKHTEPALQTSRLAQLLLSWVTTIDRL